MRFWHKDSVNQVSTFLFEHHRVVYHVSILDPKNLFKELYSYSHQFLAPEGALLAIVPYDYPLFEHTPVLNNNFEHWCHDDFGDYDYYDD